MHWWTVVDVADSVVLDVGFRCMIEALSAGV